MKAHIQFGENWVKIRESIFCLTPSAVEALKYLAKSFEEDGVDVNNPKALAELELFAKALSLINPGTDREAYYYFGLIEDIVTVLDDKLVELKEVIDRVYANRNANMVVREL